MTPSASAQEQRNTVGSRGTAVKHEGSNWVNTCITSSALALDLVLDLLRDPAAFGILLHRHKK